MRPNTGLDKIIEQGAVTFWVYLESRELRGFAERLDMEGDRK